MTDASSEGVCSSSSTGRFVAVPEPLLVRLLSLALGGGSILAIFTRACL